jgi:hypothetical protein
MKRFSNLNPLTSAEYAFAQTTCQSPFEKIRAVSLILCGNRREEIHFVSTRWANKSESPYVDSYDVEKKPAGSLPAGSPPQLPSLFYETNP